MLRKIKCDHCGKPTEKESGHINRAKAEGNKLYCDRKCAGKAKRKNRSEIERKELKRLYDIEYRAKNTEMLKEKKKVYFKKTYNPVKAAEFRKRKKEEKPEWEARRRQYMASNEYRKNKKRYDRVYRAIKTYGEEWGKCMVLVLDIRDESLTQASDYEIRKQKNTLNKCQKRRREYERLNSNKSKIGPLGNLS